MSWEREADLKPPDQDSDEEDLGLSWTKAQTKAQDSQGVQWQRTIAALCPSQGQRRVAK